MSLSSVLNTAGSGMTTTSRWSEAVSSNIANAGNPNYARRDVEIGTNSQGTPRISVISRAVDSSLDAMYRGELSRTATQDAIVVGLANYTTVLGDSESPDTILTRLTAFQNALGLLAVSPADSALQASAVRGAQDLAQALNRAGGELDSAASEATGRIAANVASVNDTLVRLQSMNEKIAVGLQGAGRSTLEDQVSAELDALAEVMDFTLRTDAQGRVELFTTGGTELLTDTGIQALRFDAAAGQLYAGNVEITPGVPGVRGISDGALAGQITLHTETLPQMRAQLDEVARALIEGMEAADPTLAPGEPGLFTDAGAALGDPFVPGLALRIAVNDAVVPEAGGASWRLRDGMGAALPGAAGDNSLIRAFGDALSERTEFDESAGLGESDSLPDYVAFLIASQNTVRARAETDAATLAAGAVAVQSTRMAFSGVNLDDELQQMMAIEQSYAANARVLNVAVEMIDTLLQIG